MKIKKRTLQIAGGTALLLIIVLVTSFTLSGGTVNATTSASKINEIAANIADFDLPQGYAASFGSDRNGKSLVIYTREDGLGRIVLMQDERQDLVNEETLRDYLEQSKQADGKLQNERLLGTDGFHLGVATTSTGALSDGTPYVQTLVVFPGKNGGAVMSIEGASDSWNVEQIRVFLASFNTRS